MKSKSLKCLILCGVGWLVGTAVSFVAQLQYNLQPDTIPTKNAILTDPTSTLAKIQAILLLIYLPLVTFPLLGCAFYHARLERKKPVCIISAVMMGFALFAVIVTLVQWLVMR